MQEDSDVETLTHTRSLGHNQFSTFLQSTPQTVQLYFSIRKLLEQIPPFYSDALLTEWKGRHFDLLIPLLRKQLNALINGSSFYHKVSKAIFARQNCLKRVKQKLNKLIPSLKLFMQEYSHQEQQEERFTKEEGYTLMGVEEEVEATVIAVRGLFLDLVQLRDMTMYIVETIHSWRLLLETHAERCKQHQPIQFIHQGRDFLQTILSDTRFIWDSSLKHHIYLPHSDDYFFIRNVAQIQQKQQKNVLEKYIVEILYPKNQEIVSKALKCSEILAYKYKPKMLNFYQQEEKLIESYLQKAKDETFKQPQVQYYEAQKKQNGQQKEIRQHKEKKLGKQEKQTKLRGWVFEQPMRVPNQSAKQRVKQLVRSHQHSMNIIKPFKIANYNQKTSIALAYLSEQRQIQENKRKITPQKYYSEGEDGDSPTKATNRNTTANEKGYATDIEPMRKKMFMSLSKLHPVIEEDPHQSQPDTPKNINKSNTIEIEKVQDNINKLKFTHHQYQSLPPDSKFHSKSQIKLNTFYKPQTQSQPFIQLQQDQSPLDLKQFLEVFRSETNQPAKAKQKISVKKIKKSQLIVKQQITAQQKAAKQKRTTAVKIALEQFKQRSKSMPYKKRKAKIIFSRNQNKQLQISQNEKQMLQTEIKPQFTTDFKQQFISLKCKTIPFQLIDQYVDYLLSQQFDSNKSFTRFSFQQIAFSLKDSFSHSLIFDLYSNINASIVNNINANISAQTEDNPYNGQNIQKMPNIGHVGQAVFAERWNKHSNRLTYTMHFIHAETFQKLVSAILRTTEELLSVTPCREVQCNFVLDKIDPVSTHFIKVLDGFLSQKTQVRISQVPRLRTTTTDIYDRIYSFTSPIDLQKQLALNDQMMSNYRSLSFKSTALVLTSNFRLRSKKLFKPDPIKYHSYSVGPLFVRLLLRVMTRYHLKQLRVSLTAQTTATEPGLLYKNPYTCSLLHHLSNRVTQLDSAEEAIKVTRFQSMSSLLHYLSYKQYDRYFKFDFLADSRFVLDHQLLLAQFQTQFSVEMTLHSTANTYHLRNYKHLAIECISSHLAAVKGYLLPTTDTNIDLLIMDAKGFLTAQTDLFSWLTAFWRQMHASVKMDLPQIVLPNLSQCSSSPATIRPFEGLLRLFVEREFYSTALLSIQNHWQNYYSDAVLRLPGTQALLLDYPLLLGFHSKGEIISCFLLNHKPQ